MPIGARQTPATPEPKRRERPERLAQSDGNWSQRLFANKWTRGAIVVTISLVVVWLRHDPGKLPSCASDKAKADVARLVSGKRPGLDEPLSVSVWKNVETVSATANLVECRAVLTFNGGVQAVASYSFEMNPESWSLYFIKAHLTSILDNPPTEKSSSTGV